VAGGQTLEVRSLPSSVATVDVEDVFPPDVPSGLVAVPGVAGGIGGEAERPAIDLSWEPNMEPRIAGYNVARRDLDGAAPNAWLQLDAEPVRETSYRDLNVVAGHRYAYRVTAVNEAGHRSAPSGEAVETAP
jgi:fibronectin type 3 domain-containing protein